jgi:prepilin-type N-terminal cleavage/methylation domain-containing protein
VNYFLILVWGLKNQNFFKIFKILIIKTIKMNKQKGFTIIELIVVIAIIAVLAAIVLVNVTQYISKGKGAAIEGNMATLLTNAAAYFEQNPLKYGSDYIGDTSGCVAGGAIVSAIDKAGATLVCNGSTSLQAWCGAVATMPTGATYASFCVDNTGYKGSTNNCAAGHFTCQP